MYDPTKEVEVVLLGDPAVEWASDEAKEEYAKKRDPALITLRDGMMPTRFFCKPVRPSFAVAAAGIVSTQQRWAFYFRGSCHRVTMPDGTERKLDPKKVESMGRGVRLAPETWVDEIGDACSLDALYGIGSVIEERAHLKAEDRGPL